MDTGIGFMVSQLDWDVEASVPCAQPEAQSDIDGSPPSMAVAQASSEFTSVVSHLRAPMAHMGDTQDVADPAAVPTSERSARIAFFCPLCIRPIHGASPMGGVCACGVIHVTRVAPDGAQVLVFEVPSELSLPSEQMQF